LKFTFDELCVEALSAEDYMTMVKQGRAHTFCVSGVPLFSPKLHNEARRFTNLVDCLYDNQCRLVCTAAGSPEELLVGMEALCSAEAQAQTSDAETGDVASTTQRSHRHGDISFQSSELSPCRPDTFATAEADAEAGNSIIHLGTSTGMDASDTADGVVGVMAAAVDSLRESGFAARRCVSRLCEMDTNAYRAAHCAKWLSDSD